MLRRRIFKHFLVLFVILIIALPFIVSCSGGDASIEGIDSNSIINLIFPNVWVFVATILSTIILFSVVIWLIWKPFNKKMEERKAYMQKELNDAEQAKVDSLKDKQKMQDDYLQAKTQINKMLLQANQKASAVYDEIKSDAQMKAHILLKNAEQDITIEKQKLQDSIEEQILDVAFAAVTEISKQKITKEQNDQLVLDFIKHLDKEK